MTSQEVSQKHSQSQDMDKSQSSAWQSTKETVSSVGANIGGAFNFSGGLSASAGAHNKTTTSTTGGGQQQKLSKREADQLYEERIEDEYAKREGGASVADMSSGDIQKALTLIDAAHSEDPTKTPSGTPYELHYANRMTHYLNLHTFNPSHLLSLAVRAQHLRRWEIPRSSYPDGKAGYFSWRTNQKKRQAELVRNICLEAGFAEDDAARVGALVAKEGLKKGEGQGDEEAQILEDCACLVFLDDQFDDFEKEWNKERNSEEADAKIIHILQKTWVKMGKKGQDLALQMELSERAKELVGRALAGGDEKVKKTPA